MRNAFAILLIALVFIQPSQLWSRASAPQASSNPDNFCVQDEATYNQYKELLPNYFQNLPVAMGVQTTVLGTDVIAVLNIGFRSDVLTLRSDVWKLGARYTDDQEIKKVCFDRKKKRMEIAFNNKETLNVRYRDEGFDTDGVTLTRLNTAQRQAYTDRIIQKENEKNGTSAPAPSAPAPNEVQR